MALYMRNHGSPIFFVEVTQKIAEGSADLVKLVTSKPFDKVYVGSG